MFYEIFFGKITVFEGEQNQPGKLKKRKRLLNKGKKGVKLVK